MITKVVAPERDCPIALRGQLTSAISPNVGNSIAQFLLVGICVRANPLQFTYHESKTKNETQTQFSSAFTCLYLSVSSS